MSLSSSSTSQNGVRGSSTTTAHVVVFFLMSVTVIPMLLFLLCYVWIWLTGIGPICVKSFIAKMLRVVKGGDVRAWNVTFLKEFGIAVGTAPSTTSHLAELKSKYNIGYVVTLNEPWEIVTNAVLNRKTMMSQDLEWYSLPTPDYGPPSLSSTIEMLHLFKENRKNGNIYFHCNAGQGRSATSVICILMALKDWTAERGYDELSSVRKISSMRGCCGHARTAHWHALKRWERYLRSETEFKNLI